MSINELTFGCEFEIFMPVGMARATLAQMITNAGVTCGEMRYGHVTPVAWKITTDGSLGDYNRGAEIVSPVLRGDEGFRQVQVVLDTARGAGCTVHRSCGFHVHVGAQGQPLDFFKRLAKLYAAYEAVLDTLLAPSRRGPRGGNGYCRSVTINQTMLDSAADMRTVTSAVNSADRYCKLNLTAYFRHGTVEFRHHQGTVDSAKAIHWIKLCLRMVLRAKAQTAGMPAATNAPLRAGRDRWLNTVVEMLLRPEGTTRAEVMAVTGQRGARLPRRTRAANLIVVRRRRNGEVRFYARRPDVASATDAALPITLDGLMQLIGADATEWTFFSRRAAAFGTAA
jgi:hypothetical protein